MYIHIFICIYTHTQRACTCAFACACASMCWCVRESVVLCVVWCPSRENGAQQLRQEMRMIGGLENLLFSTCSQDNSTWAVSWLAELTVTPLSSPSFPPLSPVCPSQKPPCVCNVLVLVCHAEAPSTHPTPLTVTFKTIPCAPSKRPVCTGTTPACGKRKQNHKEENLLMYQASFR